MLTSLATCGRTLHLPPHLPCPLIWEARLPCPWSPCDKPTFSFFGSNLESHGTCPTLTCHTELGAF